MPKNQVGQCVEHIERKGQPESCWTYRGSVRLPGGATGARTIVPMLATQRLVTAAEQRCWRSCETPVAEEEEERRKQMDLVGGWGRFDAICGGVGQSSPTWRTCPDAPKRLYIHFIFGLDMRGAGQHGRLRTV